MFDQAVMLFLYVETPLHAGSGTGLGVVDQPVQRERTTGYPMIQASGLKGCLRDAAVAHRTWCQDPRCPLHPHDAWDQKVDIIFGPDTQRAGDHAGALSVGDVRILLFPVRSLLGVFAWVTSRNVLARLERDAEFAGISTGWDFRGPSCENEAFVSPACLLVADGKVILEEVAFTAKENPVVPEIARWLKDNAFPPGNEYSYWRDSVEGRLAVLPETAFQYFVQFSTEVVARVRIDYEKKTVAHGALWTEEYLPPETLLYASLFASRPRIRNPHLTSARDVLGFVTAIADGRRLQLGGNATVGRGIVKLRFEEGHPVIRSPAIAGNGR